VNTSLTWLDMAQNELGRIGGTAFAAALRANRALLSLCICRNELGPVGGAALADALAVNTALTSLDLSENDLGPAAATSLGRALTSNLALVSLNLASNGLGAEGATALAAGLARHTALRELILDRNGLGPIGGEAIFRALSGGAASLTRLSVALNGLARSGVELATALEASKGLLHLDARANGFEDLEGQALCAAVSVHPRVVSVDLSDNQIAVLPIGSQVALARRVGLELDLSINPLSSPPLVTSHRPRPRTLACVVSTPHPRIPHDLMARASPDRAGVPTLKRSASTLPSSNPNRPRSRACG